MLTDAQVDQLLLIFQQRMQVVTDSYLSKMGQHIQKIGTLYPADVNRLIEMRRAGTNMRRVQQEIAKAYNASLDDVAKVFAAVALEDKRFMEGYFGKKTTGEGMKRTLAAQLKVTAESMQNLSNTTLVDKPYRDAVDAAINAVQSGTGDYQAQVRGALNNAAVQGLQVKYPSGYKRRADTAVRQNVLDGVRAVNQQILFDLGEEFGADGVEISAHMLCAEDHLPYQGKQYSNEKFEAIQNMLESGSGRKFGMWNCRHTMYPIILGVSEPAFDNSELEQYRKYSEDQIEINGKTMSRYEWSQEMRRTETAIRWERDKATVLTAAGDRIGTHESELRQATLKDYYKKISDGTGIKMDYTRMQANGLTQNGTNGIIKRREVDKNGNEIYKYPKTRAIQNAASFDEINEILIGDDYYMYKAPILDSSISKLPLSDQKAISEGLLYVKETYNFRGYPKSVSVANMIDGVTSIMGSYDPSSMEVLIKRGQSEVGYYLSALHESIHHFDRYGDDSKSIVSEAVSELKSKGHDSLEIDIWRYEIAGRYSEDDMELLAYSVELGMKLDGSCENTLSRTILRIFDERYKRK